MELHLISHPAKSLYQPSMWPEIGFSIETCTAMRHIYISPTSSKVPVLVSSCSAESYIHIAFSPQTLDTVGCRIVKIRSILSRSVYKLLNVLHMSTLISPSIYRLAHLRGWRLSSVLKLLLFENESFLTRFLSLNTNLSLRKYNPLWKTTSQLSRNDCKLELPQDLRKRVTTI